MYFIFTFSPFCILAKEVIGKCNISKEEAKWNSSWYQINTISIYEKCKEAFPHDVNGCANREMHRRLQGHSLQIGGGGTWCITEMKGVRILGQWLKKIHLKSYPNINSKKNKYIYIYTYIFEEIWLQYSDSTES